MVIVDTGFYRYQELFLGSRSEVKSWLHVDPAWRTTERANEAERVSRTGKALSSSQRQVIQRSPGTL